MLLLLLVAAENVGWRRHACLWAHTDAKTYLAPGVLVLSAPCGRRALRGDPVRESHKALLSHKHRQTSRLLKRVRRAATLEDRFSGL